MMVTAVALDPCETFPVGDAIVGVWEHVRVRADWADHLQMLDDREHRRLAELSSPRRATAFVAGRCCARAMLSKHLAGKAPAYEWRIDVDASGRPWLATSITSAQAISISHTDTLSVVALRRGPVGIDIEPLDRQIANDLPELRNPCTQRARLVAWTAKEARFKLDGTPVGLIRPCGSAAITDHVEYRSHLIAIATPPR